MIKLDFCKKSTEEKRQIVEKFCDFNLLRRKKLQELDKWCEKYIGTIDNKIYDFRTIVQALPDELFRLKSYLDERYDISKIMDELFDDNTRKHSYIIDTLYKNMKEEAKIQLLKNLDVTVCPYCNRNYVYSAEGINTCQLDHFIPKKKYPIFAISFYNLIPVCYTCNQKKGDTMFTFYPHDIQKDTDSLIKFTYSVNQGDYLANVDAIAVEIDTKDSAYENQIETLKLRQLYKHHRDIVLDILRKKCIFSDPYIENLFGEFSNLFKSSEELKEMIYGVSMKKDMYGQRPLTKLTQDIINEIE